MSSYEIVCPAFRANTIAKGDKTNASRHQNVMIKKNRNTRQR